MKRVYSVGQVNRYVKNMFLQDFLLQKIDVKGEVSNCKYHSSGHIYFSLKDETGTLSCVMFAGYRRGLSFPMKNGDNVVASGIVDVFERDGKYQLCVKKISLEGEGILYERFLQLKNELEEMGMFAEEYKQPIPKYIKTLGVVTAPTGAAVCDIRNIALRRNPFLQIILYPALVQGKDAAASIAAGIKRLDLLGVDTIIVGRGGGSIEDLWAFNEKIVAKAIFDCGTPIISAVGHETDFTIADFAADLRAPTPSAAAELAVEDYSLFLASCVGYRKKLFQALEKQILIARERSEAYQKRIQVLSPDNRIREKRMRMIALEEKLMHEMEYKLQEEKHLLKVYIEKFQGLSPLSKLNQGFSYVEKDEKCISSIKQVDRGDLLNIHVTDGRIKVKVEEIEDGDRKNI